VVVEAGSSTLENRGDHDGPGLAGRASKAVSGGARNWLCQLEQRRVLALAEILGTEEFGQADDAGAALGGLFDQRNGALEIDVRQRVDRHLNQANFELSGTIHTESLHKVIARLQPEAGNVFGPNLQRLNRITGSSLDIRRRLVVAR